MKGLSHDNLQNHYEVNLELMENIRNSLSDLDNMIPWEREVYVTLLMNHLQMLEQRAQEGR